MSGIDASRLAEELNALLEHGRIVTWLDRNGEYADDLDAVRELLDGATLNYEEPRNQNYPRKPRKTPNEAPKQQRSTT